MNFDLKKDDADWAQFNMVVELLAKIDAIGVVVVELYAKQECIPFKEAMERFNKKVDKSRSEINTKLDEDYGSVDLDKLQKDQ